METFEKLFPIDILILVCIQVGEIFLWDQFLSDNKTSSAYIKLLIFELWRVEDSSVHPDKSQPFHRSLNTLRNMNPFIVQLKLELLIEIGMMDPLHIVFSFYTNVTRWN